MKYTLQTILYEGSAANMQRLTSHIEEVFSSLSKSQQRVAKLILDDAHFVMMHSATEVGKRAETSETTVIRLCHALGFSGFTELQNKLRSSIVSQSSLGSYVARAEEAGDTNHFVQDEITEFTRHLIESASAIDEDSFSAATKRLHESNRIIVIGEGASKIAADWFGLTLSMLRSDVTVLTSDAVALINLYGQVTSETVVVLISMHRYYKEPIDIARHLKERGATVITITDSKVAPAVEISDHSFLLHARQHSTIELIPGVMAFLNTLASGMMRHDPPYYKKQREQFEDMHRRYLHTRWS